MRSILKCDLVLLRHKLCFYTLLVTNSIIYTHVVAQRLEGLHHPDYLDQNPFDSITLLGRVGHLRW